MSYRLIGYGIGVVFTLTMLALTGLVLMGPDVVTESCSQTHSHSWAFLTILAAALGAIGIGVASAGERQ